MPDVVVVGAGLSGLACGQALEQAGREVVVIDRNSTPGGVVQTHEIDGFLVEAGPNTVLPTPGSIEIIRDAGLEGEVLVAPPRLPRYIYINGHLRKAPWVLSPRGMARVLWEPFVRRRLERGDESLASFCVRRFGREVHDRLLAPFVSGIYAGNTRDLGIEGTFPRLAELERNFGSVLIGGARSRRAGPRPRLSSFRQGMASLPVALASRLDVRLDVSEVRVFRTGVRGWQVDCSAGAFDARSVVLALPAYAISECLDDSVLCQHLSRVDYAPILVAAGALDKSQIDTVPRGFGFLVPRTEGLRVLGTLFSSSIFPGRAPAGKILLTTFLGGALDKESVDWTDARIWETLETELREVLGFRGGLRPLGLYRYSRGIPQYRVGHTNWRQQVRDCLAGRPGLFLTGNYLDGVSVPLTLEHGKKTGEAVDHYLDEAS